MWTNVIVFGYMVKKNKPKPFSPIPAIGMVSLSLASE